jgi:hypothetical protein
MLLWTLELTSLGGESGGLGGDSADAIKNPAYANFAHGDESLEAIYGSSLPKLREVKKKWDPKGVFGQWFFYQTDLGSDNMGMCVYERPNYTSQHRAETHSYLSCRRV